jgi:hypothetical protein
LFITVITNVAIPPEKRQAGLFVMAAVKPQLKPGAIVTVDEVMELEVLDVPETVVQLLPVLAQAVNLTVPPAGPFSV